MLVVAVAIDPGACSWTLPKVELIVTLTKFNREFSVEPSSTEVIAMSPPPVASIVVFWETIDTPFMPGAAVRIPVIETAVPETLPDEIVLVEPL
jgi:hypothetical protein